MYYCVDGVEVKQAQVVFIGQIAMATPRDTTAAALIDGLSVTTAGCGYWPVHGFLVNHPSLGLSKRSQRASWLHGGWVLCSTR